MQTAVMTDTEFIQNIHTIYGSELEGLDDSIRMQAIAVIALGLSGWVEKQIYASPLALQLPPELHAHMIHLSPKGKRTLINCLNCAPRHV